MKQFVLSASILLFVNGIASGQITVAGDNFESSSHPTGDRTVVAGGINGIRFFTHNATGANYTAAIIDDSGAGGLGSTVLTHIDSTGSAGNQIIGLLPVPITLGTVGDFITLNFTFRYTNIGTATTNNAGFRFGLESSNGTPITGDGQSVSDNDQGFYVQTGVGTTGSATNATLWRESGGTTPILGGLDRTTITTNTGGAAFNDISAHTVSFTITRGTGTNMSFSLSYDGGTPITATTTSGPLYTFDEIAFGNGFVANPVGFNIDNITVVSSVPEPGTGALALAGIAGMLGRRRRRIS